MEITRIRTIGCETLPGGLCLPVVREMCVCSCDFAHISLLLPLTTQEGALVARRRIYANSLSVLGCKNVSESL